MSVGRLAARAVIGGLFIGHGGQKLFGWFGGPGRAGTEGMMESLQMRPAKVHALAAGISETAGGALLLTGLATPLAAATLTGVMTTAIRKVHAPNGPWATNGGWEYNAVLIAAVTALAETGPGAWSLDRHFGIERTGTRWALAALVGGVASAFATMASGARGATAPGVESATAPGVESAGAPGVESATAPGVESAAAPGVDGAAPAERDVAGDPTLSGA